MLRLRTRAGLFLLVLLTLGIASSAGATLLASGGCCPATGAAERSAPCASLAPTSCCEERVPAASPAAPHAPVLAIALVAAPELAIARAPAALALASPRSARHPLATVVLRL